MEQYDINDRLNFVRAEQLQHKESFEKQADQEAQEKERDFQKEVKKQLKWIQAKEEAQKKSI